MWGNYRRRILFHARVHLWTPHYPRLPWLHWAFAYSDLSRKKGKLAPLQERNMVDKFRLWAKGGEGGNGCCSYRRSRSDRFGRPDGGNGGRGGDVILECSLSVWDLSNLQHHLNARRGGHGSSKIKIGSRGSDKVAFVPVGTVIHLVSGESPIAESSPNTSLDPWDMSTDDNEQANSLHQMNEMVNATCSSHVEDSHATTLFAKHHVDKSLHDARESFRSSTFPEVEQQEDTNVDGLYRKATYMDQYKETNDDENSDENGIRTKENEEVEEEEEDEEEVVQYSVAELTQPGQRLLVARGGEGGLGNVASLKGCRSRRNANYQTDVSNPETLFENSLATGKPGSESVLILELKSIADVGLIGIPNAGKSTLLGAISKAKPTVGDYAFTTLRPNIGKLNYDDFFSIKVADIPGLIKGAHVNRGLGHAFLRHIERTKVLVYVVDLAAALGGKKGIPPWEQLRDLALELECHQEGLSSRPSLVVANKIDEHGAEQVLKELETRVQDVPIFPVCAILEEGVPELKSAIRKLIDGSELHTLNLENILVN